MSAQRSIPWLASARRWRCSTRQREATSQGTSLRAHYFHAPSSGMSLRSARGILLIIALVTGCHWADAAIAFGTGLSYDRNPVVGAERAARQARAGIGKVVPKLVLLWDNYGGANASSILSTVQAVFPKVPVVGQHESAGLTGYIPYTNQGHGDSACAGVAVIAGDLEVRVAYVSGIDGLALKSERDAVKKGLSPEPLVYPKARALADSLKAIPASAKALILMGTLHDPGCKIFAPVLDSILGYRVPMIAGASGDSAHVYVKGAVIVRAAVAVLLSGDFAAGFGYHNAGREKRTDQTMALAGESSTARDLREACPEGYTAKGMIWFNCRRRTSWEWWRPTQTALDSHVTNMRQVTGNLPFWGHVSANEACTPAGGGHVIGSSALAAMTMLYSRAK